MKKKSVIILVVVILIVGVLSFFFIFNGNNDFNIKNDVLISYTGDEDEVTVPDNVKKIASDAFSSDMGRGENLKKVVIPGSVYEIDDRAFAFTAADIIVINEGVKVLGAEVFMDSYIDEIYFPRSIEVVGPGIMETEEGLSGTLIHVYKGSYMDNYFKKYEPYGDFKIIYEK